MCIKYILYVMKTFVSIIMSPRKVINLLTDKVLVQEGKLAVWVYAW